MSFLGSQDFFHNHIIFRGTDTNISSWQRGFWSRTLRFGVPQGSVAGPQTFVCYTEDLQEVVTSFEIKLPSVCRRQPASRQGNPPWTWMPLASGSRAVSNQFVNGAQAADFNWILIRQNWFGSAWARCSWNSRDLRRVFRVGGMEVEPVESVRDLGVTLDCQLNMRAHISKIVSACYYHLCRIRQHQHCLDKVHRQRFISALVLSRTDYCNVTLVGLPAFHWLLSSESLTPLLASSPTSDLATMSAMFCVIYMGSQSVSEYHTRCASWCSASSME